jgi:peptidoglycan/LPS O-acetylase OafA/YrhL
MKPSQRIYGLDILRATAILLVVVFHCGQFISRHTGREFFRAIPDGVTLFFVLSGFLIGRILPDRINSTDFSFKQLKDFWYRRWLRTLPAYFFVLLLLILHRIQAGGAGELQAYLKFFFFTQNINDGTFYFFPESWSLSVEEWFYVLFPLLFFISVRLFPSRKKTIILFWIILAMLFSMVIRFVRSDGIGNYSQWNEYIRKAVITRFDSITIGFAGAFLFYYKYKVWGNKRFLFWLGILLLLLSTVVSLGNGFNWFTVYLKIPLESVGTLFLLPALTSYKTGKRNFV